MPGQGQIGSYHNDVVADVQGILNVRVTFRPLDNGDWYKVRDGTEVEFDLVSVDPVKSETATRMRRGESRTHRVSVFPLSARLSSSVGTFWASWHETWSKQDSKSFVLLNAGWTLFEGLSGNPDKVQVLRVDWDQLSNRGSDQAGHPHWHFDHELFFSEVQEKIEVAQGLVEVSPESSFSIGKQASVGFIHLAMGAWNSNIDHPECWQRTYEGDCRLLRDWCIKTLMYLKGQVGGS